MVLFSHPTSVNSNKLRIAVVKYRVIELSTPHVMSTNIIELDANIEWEDKNQ